jgi:DNA polymerase-3 subunit delta
MKIDPRRVEAFLADPGGCRVILLYGEDSGLVRERGGALVRQIAGSPDDPFRVAELERDGVSRLVEAMAARPLTGGRRAVRVRDVTDAAAGAVQAALASKGEGMVVLEAGELTGRSKLRSLVEGAADGAAIACYSEQGADLARTIVSVLSAAGLRADPEAAEFLSTHLGNDRGVTRQELDKLALYVHPHTLVDLDAAMAMVGDLAGLQIEDALYAAAEGDVATADRALGLALGEGASPVSVLRTLLIHLQKQERVQLAMQSGQSAAEAVRSLRPPVFFRRQDSMIRAAGLWPAQPLAAACTSVWEAERACKRTGAPSLELCRHAVSAVARRAAGRRRR